MENITKVKPNKTINSLFRTFFKSLVTHSNLQLKHILYANQFL